MNDGQDSIFVRTGVDLMKLGDFARSLEEGGEPFLSRLFHQSEVTGASNERLAGIFAAKEAAFKAMGLPKGDWHVLEVRHDGDGRPHIVLAPSVRNDSLISSDVSISHSGEYVVASVVTLWRGDQT